MTDTPWRVSWRADPAAAAIADRHYNRQSIGSPQFVPPGRCLVMLSSDGTALWVTSWPLADYVQHAWAGAWINSTFRKEGPGLASDMIRHAVGHTRAYWPAIPPLGIITFIDPGNVRHKRDPGRCYRKAGWRHVGYTQGGLWAYQQLPHEMPPPAPLPGMTEPLFAAELLGGDHD